MFSFTDAIELKKKSFTNAILEVQRMGDDFQQVAWQTHDNEQEVLDTLQVNQKMQPIGKKLF